MEKKLVAIDVFCGIGGLTHGFVKEGIKVIAGIDNDESCRYAYEKNNKAIFIAKDIRDVTGNELNNLYPKNSIKILIGCAPCQTFSQYTQKIRNREKDEKWNLLYHFLRLIKETDPDIVSMENVPQLIKYKIFDDFINGLYKIGYFVTYKIVNCSKYGIPQRRIRLVLIASKNKKISLIPETHNINNYRIVRDFIKDLPKIKDGEINDKDPVHRSWKLSPINKKRIMQSKPEGSWMDWDEDLVLKCHKKKKGRTYKAVYGRMSWNKPSPTITTQFYSYGTGRFGHPVQNRAISLREGAILQTFPRYYKFSKNENEISFSEVGRHIGNAVPVKLGRIIAKSIKEYISF